MENNFVYPSVNISTPANKKKLIMAKTVPNMLLTGWFLINKEAGPFNSLSETPFMIGGYKK